jgi:putative membrane protein
VNYNVTPDKLILRDYLAAERTHLANERTLLAYLRSALILFIAAITILKIFEGDHTMRWIAFSLGPLSMFTGIFGVYRYRRTRKKLMAFDRKKFETTESATQKNPA